MIKDLRTELIEALIDTKPFVGEAQLLICEIDTRDRTPPAELETDVVKFATVERDMSRLDFASMVSYLKMELEQDFQTISQTRKLKKIAMVFQDVPVSGHLKRIRYTKIVEVEPV